MSGTAGLFEDYEIHAPPFSAEDGQRLAAELFGVEGKPVELGSHQDRNYRITTPGGRRTVLKIANPHFGRGSLELQNDAMAWVSGRVPFETPQVVAALDGSAIATVDRDGVAYDVRMVEYLDGEPLLASAHLSDGILEAVGRVGAGIAAALDGFDHPAADRVLQWDVRHARAVVDGLIRHVADPARRALVERAMVAHDEAMARLAPLLRTQVVHGDVTDYNVIGRRGDDGRLWPSGLIDFGDSTRTYLAAEPAVAATSVIAHAPGDPLGAMLAVLRGFHAELPLTEAEISAYFPLVVGRAALCAVSTDQQAALDPDNDYATGLIEVDWGTLAAVADVPPALAEAVARAACGLDPHPRTGAVRGYLASVRAVPPVDPAGRTLRRVDLGVGSAAYAHGEWETAAGIAAAASAGPGELGIGRHGEARLHRAGRPREGGPDAIHLGADVFAEPGETVRAPLAGVVVGRDDGSVTLRHDAPDGPLWLRLEGVAPSPAGEAVAAGDPVGIVGPAGARALAHLHVQVSLEPIDPLPEWAAASAATAWLALCPDPSPLLGVEPEERPRRDLLARRRGALADAQRLYYEHPPEMVRGWRHHLYDADARPYLDIVNNVAVLGHSHPAVAEAAFRQFRLLNTNSRFLYAGMARFAERLLELVPAPLDRVFLVNSGSEANDLALRLARTATGRRDTVALAGAYHGWTSATFEVSTSLFDNPEGLANLQPHVQVVLPPDTYRGEWGADDPAAGERYAAAVGDAAARAGGLAAFICEPQLGNSGGLLAPDGYLAAAYRHVRAAGGLCIADEVQVGYGRMGRWFWAFEQQGVVPDIVTIAKSTGNGHPVGAVVTTAAIAEAFDRGGSFFSSVGGSPVSCEVGIAVLDAIRDERLQENAVAVGDHLRAGLEECAGRHELIGAVHGTGLYMGVELVRDRATKEPATAEAYALCERLRELGAIVQPTGDYENVLKIKPPLCIDRAGADHLVEALDRALRDGW